MTNNFRKILKKHYRKNLEIISKIQKEINSIEGKIEKDLISQLEC